MQLRLPAVLRALLSREGRSQRWLMSRCKFSAATVNRIIHGVQEPGREHLHALCAAFPEWQEQRQVIMAYLQDQLNASGVDPRRVSMRALDEIESENLHLLPEMNGYLQVITHRLLAEVDLPERRQIVTRQVEWLSEVVVRLTALEADHAAAYPESEDKTQEAAEPNS